MRSKIAEQIINETPPEVREKVRAYGDAIHRAYQKGFEAGTKQTGINLFVSGSLPTDEDIVRWSNEVAELTDEQKEYTATGSRIAIQERCAGARWMLTKLSGQ